MKSIVPHLKSLSLMLFIPIFSIFYRLLNNADRGAYSLVTDLDRNIPFVKEFIVPYIVWYVFIFGMMVFFCLKDKRIYYRTLLSIILGSLVCYGTYFVFQTHVPRPELAGHDVFTKLVALIYSYDRPYNAFPSIHVLTTFLMVKGINKYRGKNLWNISLVYLNAVLIILSTLFVKQHVVLDVMAGILLANAVFDLVYSLDAERLRTRVMRIMARKPAVTKRRVKSFQREEWS